MISSAADYAYVTGISNGEVLINGHIMPWRDVNGELSDALPTDKPECLRGEDICFLYEKKERMRSVASNSSRQTLAYNPRLDAAQLRKVMDIANLYRYQDRGRWILSGDFTMDKFPTTWSGQQLDALNFALSAYEVPPLSALTPYYDNPNALSADVIRRLFRDVRDARYFLADSMYISLSANGTTNTTTAEVDINAGTTSPSPIQGARVAMGEVWHYNGRSGSAAGGTAAAFEKTGDDILLSTATSYLTWQHAQIDNVLALYYPGMSNTNPGEPYTGVLDSSRDVMLHLLSCEKIGDRSIRVPVSEIMAGAHAYDQHFGFTSNYITRGKTYPSWALTNNPTRTTSYSLFYYLMPLVYLPDVDFLDIGWNWEPV